MPKGQTLHRGGTYLCMEGPAFSTRASELYRSWGCDVIGMTNHTEARLARGEIAYASLSMVTDYDCWHTDHDAVSVDIDCQPSGQCHGHRANSSRGDGSVHRAPAIKRPQRPCRCADDAT